MGDGRLLGFDFGTGGNGETHCRSGWSRPEAGFCWAIGFESTFTVAPPASLQRAWLSVWVHPHLNPPRLAAQRLELLVNDIGCGSFRLTGHEARLDIELPAELLGLNEPLLITLRHPDATSPNAFGTGSSDIRPLAVAVRSAALYDAPPPSLQAAAAPEPARPAADKPFLAVCAIARNEGRYIYEWLSFHYQVGVRKFFIYENHTSDNMLDEIRRWPMHDCVTVIPWPGVNAQIPAYTDMIAHHADAAEWCAFIDCDEFLCPRGDSSIIGAIRALDPLCNGIYVHWMMFGSAGQERYADAPVTERFLRRGHEQFGPNNVGKTIVRLSSALGANSPHVIRCAGRLINDAGAEIDQAGIGLHVASSHRRMSLNHYFTKSIEEWNQRRAYGRSDKDPSDKDFIRSREDFDLHNVNDVEDGTAAEIMQAARARFY